MKPLLLFDVDGTLLLTGGAGMRAMRRVAESLFGPEFRWDGIEVSGHLDPLIFAEAAARNGIDALPTHHESFRRAYLDALRDELEVGGPAIRAMPGIHDALRTLRQRRDATLGLLTGNYTAAIPLKLGSIGLDPAWFEITAFGDEGDSRAALVELALLRYARALGRTVDPSRVVIVGDTPRDVECAHAHGCFAFGVATGRYGVEELRAARADHVVADLADPEPLFTLVRRLCESW